MTREDFIKTDPFNGELHYVKCTCGQERMLMDGNHHREFELFCRTFCCSSDNFLTPQVKICPSTCTWHEPDPKFSKRKKPSTDRRI